MQEYNVLPDILRLISTKTLLKRETVNSILQASGRAAEFLINPQQFYEQSSEIIEKNRHNLAIDGISYIKLDGEEYYVQEIFESAEFLGILEKNAVPVAKSLYDHVKYDSETEKNIAKALEEHVILICSQIIFFWGKTFFQKIFPPDPLSKNFNSD